MMQPDELKYWLALSRFAKIGPQRLARLLQYFASPKDIWLASPDELRRATLEDRLAEEFSSARANLDPDRELAIMLANQVSAVAIIEDAYPRRLKQIYQAPFLLYYRGDLADLSEQTLAIVGTRFMTSYGALAVEKIVPPLVASGLAIASGLALGTDAKAHLETLTAGGRTFAVLGSGLDNDNIYPAANRALAEKIMANHGLLISEYPVGTLSLKHHFPQRNRIISGLSLGTLVIEAPESSGALITAACALEQNREVFAIPGPIHSQQSLGANNLIKKGAKLVLRAEDILEELNIQEIKKFAANREQLPATPEQAAIINLLKTGAKHVNELVKESALNTQEVNASLMLLEMQGRVRHLGGMIYILLD